MWEFEIIKDWGTIMSDSFYNKWTDLFKQSDDANVFFHPTVAMAWIKTYLPLRKISPLFFLGTNSVSGSKAFMPFIYWHMNAKNMFQRVIVPLGYSDFDYHNMLFTNNEHVGFDDKLNFFSLCIEHLKHLDFDRIHIDGIKDISNFSQFNWKVEDACPYLQLDKIQTEGDLLSFFKSSLRGDLRRQMRRLEKIGTLSLCEYTSWKEVEPTFQLFIDAHIKRWPNAYKAPHFHENLLKAGLGNVVHFSSLNIDSIPIAWHLGFEYQGCYYYYMPAGNADFLRYSPVKVHLFYLMRRAVEKGYNKYDHLRGEENYKDGWSNGLDYVNSLVINNPSLLSRSKFGLNKFVRKLLK